MEKTWTKDKVLWPAELLPKDVPDARVFLFGYDTGITHLNQGEVTKTELHSDADDLCAKLVAERSRTPEAVSEIAVCLDPASICDINSLAFQENRPIIIIAHSLGGLVTAQLFVHGEQSSNDSSAKAIVRNIRGMIFLGTPFRGSVPAGLAECVRRILKLVGVDTQEHTLNLLGVNSEKLNELTRSFSNLLIKRRMSKDPGDQINAFFFYETLPTRIGIKYTQVRRSKNTFFSIQIAHSFRIDCRERLSAASGMRRQYSHPGGSPRRVQVCDSKGRGVREYHCTDSEDPSTAQFRR
jgi:hypothetical protein